MNDSLELLKNLQVTHKISQQMMYIDIKSHKNLQRYGKNKMISIECRRKI